MGCRSPARICNRAPILRRARTPRWRGVTTTLSRTTIWPIRIADCGSLRRRENTRRKRGGKSTGPARSRQRRRRRASKKMPAGRVSWCDCVRKTMRHNLRRSRGRSRDGTVVSSQLGGKNNRRSFDSLRSLRMTNVSCQCALPHRRFSCRRYRDLLHDFDSEALEAGDLTGMIGQQANALEVQVRQDLRANADLALGAPLALGQGCQLLLVVELDGHMVAESLYRIALGGRVQVDQRAAAFF